MPQMNSLQSIMWAETLLYVNFSLLTYVPEKNITATLHIYIPLHRYFTLHTDPTWLYVLVKTQCNFNLPHCCHICASDKYALKCHTYDMPKLLNMHLWEMYANIYATDKVALISEVAIIAVHRGWWWCQCDADDNNNDDATAQLHMSNWPSGQINQKWKPFKCSFL